jgi:hypothetical protein
MAVVTVHEAHSVERSARESRTIPRPQIGDRPTRAEFERRYDAMPELKKAELIEGELALSSPARHGCTVTLVPGLSPGW